MTKTKTIKNPSPLVLAVLTLDEHFMSLQRLADRIDEIDVKSNFDLKQSEKLLNAFTEAGQAIGEDVNNFVAILNKAQAEAESAAQKVAARAEHLKIRKDEIQEKMAQFQNLSQKVHELNSILVIFKRPPGEILSEQESADLKSKLGQIAGHVNLLIDEAEKFREIGHVSKIKILEQNAESLRQSLVTVSKKISEIVPVQ